MSVTVVRPDSTPTGASNFTIFGGSATINAALADNSDSTYVRKGVTGNGAVIVGFGTTTILSSVRVKQVRLRARVSCPTSASRLNVTPVVRVDGVNYSGSAISFAGIYALGTYVGAYFTTAPDGQAWDQDRIDGLRAQIMDTKTSSDLSSVYELYFDVDTTTQPTVTVSNPTGTVTNTSQPDVSWSYADADGSDQDYYRIRVFPSSVYAAPGFDPISSTSTWDSGVVASSDNSATITDYLTNGTWRAYVTVAKTVSGVPFYSAYAYAQFILSTTPPTTPTVQATYNSANNRVTLSMTGATVAGSFDSQEFTVQRSADSGVTWGPVVGGTGLVVDGTGAAALFDYSAPRGITVLYRVRSVGLLTGDFVATPWSATDSVAVTNDGTWWLKSVTTPSLNTGGLKVAAGFESTPVEQVGVFRPLGRVSAVVVSAGLQGEDGKVKITAVGMAEFNAVWNLVTSLSTLVIQSPVPTQKTVRVIDRSFTRGGLASNPLSEINVSFVEVEA